MTNSRDTDFCTDARNVPLRTDEVAIRGVMEYATLICANQAPHASLATYDSSIAKWLARQPVAAKSSVSCRQKIWISFFFDGTGNNLDADVGSLKHSSVAKLYRVHPDDNAISANYRVYIPGVGTYFKAIGDDGGGTLGLGTGFKGDARLDWALGELDARMEKHVAWAQSESSTIEEVNVAVFGFSRGAALARAFVNRCLEKRCKMEGSMGWRLKSGGYRFRIRFLGLFDTVASVGMPLSNNTTSKIGAARSNIAYIINARVNDEDYASARPNIIAFDSPVGGGADPAPGSSNGHDAWGGALKIPAMVEEVRHFIAAHEIRNSFPVDSVSRWEHGIISKPTHFFETVYPGAHSDVGGSYRPGEGARSDIAADRLGLIPLRHMYDHAIAAGVPLRPETDWSGYNESDFRITKDAMRVYNEYISKLGTHSTLGDILNAHMGLYYRWRFRSIRLKQRGDRSGFAHISNNTEIFASERTSLDTEVADLKNKNELASRSAGKLEAQKRVYINNNYGAPDFQARLNILNSQISAARSSQAEAQDKFLKARARRDALPTMDNMNLMLDFYDKQLLLDAKSIYDIYMTTASINGKVTRSNRARLRPHYKVMMDAYENEYLRGDSVLDASVVSLFDNYVHDSLAAFAKDATLPSDPRVVFLGGDAKYGYASNHNSGSGFPSLALQTLS